MAASDRLWLSEAMPLLNIVEELEELGLHLGLS